MGDPFNLQRFADAQHGTYLRALDELRAGRKRTHWMWFIFPQLGALGRSETARLYGVSGLDEAKAYQAHPILGPRLEESVNAVLAHADRRSAEEMLGPVDAIKLRSCLTLFQVAGGGACLGQALAAFFGGEPDPFTLELLAAG